MNQTYIGIDFSLNSTAICILNNQNYSFYNIVNTETILNKKGDKVLSDFKIHDDIKDFVNIIFNKRTELSDEYSIAQNQKINDYDKLTDKIINLIPENSIIGLEGFSYASTGRSDIDLIMAQTLLRFKIIKNNHELKIISPANLKKFFTGKGNANKIKMLEAFNNIKDFKHPLYQYVIKNDLIKNNKNVLKPIDDLIDAYSIVKFLNQ